MASGDTLAVFTPQQNEPPSANYATLDTRNGHLILRFDQTTQEAAVFSRVLPRNYSALGVTVYIHWTTTATTGTVGWVVEIERDTAGGQDVDSDGFAAEQTVTAATVPGTSGVLAVTNVAIAHGAALDNLVGGEKYRIRIKRDVANDTAAADAELHCVELKET